MNKNKKLSRKTNGRRERLVNMNVIMKTLFKKIKQEKKMKNFDKIKNLRKNKALKQR